MEILESRFSSLGANFYGEICDKFAKEIVLGDKRSKVQWIQIFDNFFKEYSERKLGDFSITNLTAQLQKTDPEDPVIPYVTEILLSNEKGLDLAADPEELHRTLNSYRAPIKANKEALEKEVKDYLDNPYILNIRVKNTGNNKKTDKENIKVDTELIKHSFEQVVSRHKSMSELLDGKYTWTVEFGPVFWKVSEDPNAVFKEKENPVLAPQRHLVMEAMAAGLYTMEEKEFKELIERQKTFFAAAEMADKIFDKLVKEHLEEKYQMTARHALIDYFRADLMQGAKQLDIMEMQNKAEEILQDEIYRKCLLTGVLMEEVSSEVSSKFIGIASLRKPLKTEERTMHTVANRETMENFLYQDKKIGYGASKYGREYNQLNYFQRQIFALAVLQWDEKEMLPSMQFIISKELAESRHTIVANQFFAKEALDRDTKVDWKLLKRTLDFIQEISIK